jgi:mRNA interferase HigB
MLILSWSDRDKNHNFSIAPAEIERSEQCPPFTVLSAPSIECRCRLFSIKWNFIFQFLEFALYFDLMIVIGTDIAEAYFKSRAGHRGIKAARAQYDAWLAIAETADWRTPEAVKRSHPKASILKGSRVVFNIKANDFRLVALVQYVERILMIRFFGSHEEYDDIDAGAV